MSIDNYTDYIKEDTWYGPAFQSTDAYSQHDSLYPHTPAFDIDFEVLRRLAQDEIQAVEQPIGNEGGQSRWVRNVCECDEVAGGLENHLETVGTVFSSNHWGMSPTPDTCASTWSTLGLSEALPPNIQNETSPIQGPTLYHQPTKPSANGPPLEHAKNFMPGLHLGAKTRITHGASNPFLQAAASETFYNEVSHLRATHDTSDRSMGPSFMQSFPNGQPLGGIRLHQPIESPPSLVPQNSAADHALPSVEEETFSAGFSSNWNRQRSRVSAPLQYANGWSISRNGALPGSQSSLPRSPAKRATTHRTPSRKSRVKRVQSKRKMLSSKRLDSQELKRQLKQRGFVFGGTIIRCKCNGVFTRPADAMRHWRFSSQHRSQRQEEGDPEESPVSQCDVCEEVLARSDSLARHRLHCGERKKRIYPHGWNPSGRTQ